MCDPVVDIFENREDSLSLDKIITLRKRWKVRVCNLVKRVCRSFREDNTVKRVYLANEVQILIYLPHLGYQEPPSSKEISLHSLVVIQVSLHSLVVEEVSLYSLVVEGVSLYSLVVEGVSLYSLLLEGVSLYSLLLEGVSLVSLVVIILK
jgi:hypothetical protein